ncbi:MAG: radical SAM protein [Candidatus Pacearchaeota archaeon]|jgi:radical SAM superfamily enzyme YgiQ (UPF0313 family)
MEFSTKSKKVLFVFPAYDHESLGLEVLSASLKKAGHSADLILNHPDEKYFKKRLIKRILDFKPDFIGFSVMTDDYLWACETSKFIKSFKDIPIIFGGIQATSCTDEVISNSFVDYAVVGEAEEALIELIENPKRTNIKNVWSKKNNKIYKNPLRPLIQDLDSIPFPDKGLFLKEAPYLGEIYYIMTGRGCPYACTYCFNNYMRKAYKGCKWLRRRSVENVMEELRLMKKKNMYKMVLFGDDVFTYDVNWLREFFKYYTKEINLPFKSLGHTAFITPEIVSLLKKGGCIRLQIGVQTPSERIRRDICKRNDTNKMIYEAIKEIKKQGIMVQIDHMFGLPTESAKEYRESMGFYIDIKPHYISDFWLQYYPNTDIINVGLSCGDIDNKLVNDTIKGKVNYSEVILKRKQDKEILAMSRFIKWIPLLPRGVSWIILKNNLYRIFISDKINMVPYILQHMKSPDLMKTAYRSYRRKKVTEKLYRNLDKKFANFKIPKKLD